MTRDEQFQTLLRLYTASMEHNIVLRGKLTISQPIGTDFISANFLRDAMSETYIESDATLKRIYKILFDGEFRDQDGFLIQEHITPAADHNLLRAIETVKDAGVGLSSGQRNKLLAILGRVHDQLQDVRNILKGEDYE